MSGKRGNKEYSVFVSSTRPQSATWNGTQSTLTSRQIRAILKLQPLDHNSNQLFLVTTDSLLTELIELSVDLPKVATTENVCLPHQQSGERLLPAPFADENLR